MRPLLVFVLQLADIERIFCFSMTLTFKCDSSEECEKKKNCI